ncbi:unnamed protein product [Vicia faba]|uniref:Uncharacterized protein n=1 Tax=Vicia faba TaxID=3906 RepID=A0AAV1A3X9_VICFA|nr:unnamed protein product [Vicia faba]
MPNYLDDKEITNLVIHRQNWVMDTTGRMKFVWYLPTEFPQYAMNRQYPADHVRKVYQAKFMTIKSSVNKNLRLDAPPNSVQVPHDRLETIKLVPENLHWVSCHLLFSIVLNLLIKSLRAARVIQDPPKSSEIQSHLHSISGLFLGPVGCPCLFSLMC